MREYAIYLGYEECGAYGRIEAEDLDEAIEEGIERMADNVEEDGWTFKRGQQNHIDMYFEGELQNIVSVEEVA